MKPQREAFYGVLIVTMGLSLGLASKTSIAASSRSDDRLDLDGYLSHVPQGNLGVKGAAETAEGAMQRSAEKNNVLAPSFFANARLGSDGSQLTNFAYLSEKLVNNSYSLGFSQQTSFGLSGRLYYEVDYTDIVNTKNPLISPMGGSRGFYDSKPVMELNFSLWRNGLGKEARATEELVEAGALATSYGQSFGVKQALAQAEAAYWRLALARETLVVQRDSMERAKKIRDWNARRYNLQLADKADLLQAEALVQARSLELQGAIDEEAAASRAFNTARGTEGDRVAEILTKVDAVSIDRIALPIRAAMREDVQAARESEKAAVASGHIGAEKNKPSLDLFGSAALNGENLALSKSVGSSFAINNPTYAAGFKFTMPLDLGSQSASREGYAREAEGAALSFQRKLYEQERDWTDLNNKLSDARRRYQLATAMEAIQKEKLDHERDRLNRGRTVTFQVLSFEQDYQSAQLARIRAQADILMLVATMKTYGGAQ